VIRDHSGPTLTDGDELHCRRWHPVTLRHTEGTEYTRRMLYWECRGQHFYAGQVRIVGRHQTRPQRRMMPAMTTRPDEDRDAIIHYVEEIDASTGERRDTWMLYVGQTRIGDETTEDRAIRSGLHLGREHGKPVWFLDRRGYPLKPITDDDRTVSFVASCPKGHKPSIELKAGAVRHRLDELEFFCISCGQNFKPDAKSKANLRRYVDSADSWY